MKGLRCPLRTCPRSVTALPSGVLLSGSTRLCPGPMRSWGGILVMPPKPLSTTGARLPDTQSLSHVRSGGLPLVLEGKWRYTPRLWPTQGTRTDQFGHWWVWGTVWERGSPVQVPEPRWPIAGLCLTPGNSVPVEKRGPEAVRLGAGSAGPPVLYAPPLGIRTLMPTCLRTGIWDGFFGH